MTRMTVKVKFFASFREIVGEKEVSVLAEDVSTLLEKLSKEYGGLKEALFENYENKELKKYVNIFMNGRAIRELGGLNTSLKEGDTVTIFPPVAGG